MKKPWFRILLPVFGALLLLGGWRHYDRNRTREVHMPMKPYAVGRFLLDIPEPSELAGWGRQFVDGLGELRVLPSINVYEFQKMIRERVQELKSVERDFVKYVREDSYETIPLGRGTLLEKHVEGPLPNEHQVLFWDDSYSKPDYCKFETYYWLQEPKNLPGTGVGYCFYGSGTPIDPAHQREYLADDARLLKLIRPRKDDEIPEGPGFCFQRSFLPLPPREKVAFEVVSAEWRLKTHPDVVVSIYTQGASEPEARDGGLLKRNQAPMPESLAQFVRGIRARKRTVGRYAGEEVVERVKEENGTFGFSAQWEFGGGDPEDMTSPMIVIGMFSGSGGGKEPVNSSVTESQFLDMWDAVLESLRVRPTTSAASQPEK